MALLRGAHGGEEGGSLCFLLHSLLPWWGAGGPAGMCRVVGFVLGPGFPGHRVLPRQSEFLEGGAAAAPAGRAHGEGLRPPPNLSRVPTKIWPSSSSSWGAPVLSPLPALHHKTDYPRPRGTLKGRGCLLGGLLAVPQLGSPSRGRQLLWHLDPLTPRAYSAPGSKASPGTLSSQAHKGSQGQQSRGDPAPCSKNVGQCREAGSYLGQQPEGEEEHGVHGATGRPSVRPRAELRLLLRQNH